MSMRKIQFKNRTITDNSKPYFIAELNTSHFGDINIAKAMIKNAKLNGCDCIKLQSWTSDTLYSQNFYNENPIAKKFIKKYSLNEKQILILSNYCKKIKIGFSSTPYSEAEVDFLVHKCNAAFIKIASMDINNHLFLKYIAKKNMPIVLSTGMASTNEIDRAVTVIKKAGNSKICILHCTSLYPTPEEIVNLKNISKLRQKFRNLIIGFSDHTLGNEAAISSIALGARVIEKHFTLDKNRIGMDNQIALEPPEMKELIKKCNKSFLTLGMAEKKLSIGEKEQKKKMRRSVVAKYDLKKGTIIKLKDLDLKRPGTGIPADKIEKLIGKRTKKKILKDYLILYKDFK
tara:strand:+ start:2442 stop:3476 length:1035 start_codon:yes stop_codon:yes gene_type:complete